ncbi:hypothetical protein FN846DRAFT_610792 [Sphaerosporella brunnea]|uniref:Fibroin-3 related protein n=1 Tax=Sphaerosporella brunnea TaxID=1250544 RepID=A0A5J5F133_9PEZI|nr:hypothetical protein FN846DRAFT_610792 [Sphaerosporella brunnea]
MGVIQQRSIGDDLANFSTTFTSFDKCMQKDICKIPFIVGCVIAGIIVFSTLWCLFRCIMCGYACCSCCCGGCGGRRHKTETTTYVLPPPPPPPLLATRPPHYDHDEPKYAYFESRNDDALPHMPSANGVDVKQRFEIEEHEMEPVRRTPTPQKQPLHAPLPTRPGEIDAMRVQHNASTVYGNLAPPERAASAAPTCYSNSTPLDHSQNAGTYYPNNNYNGGFAPGYNNGGMPLFNNNAYPGHLQDRGLSPDHGIGSNPRFNNPRDILASPTPGPYHDEHSAQRGFGGNGPADSYGYQEPYWHEYSAPHAESGYQGPHRTEYPAAPVQAYQPPHAQAYQPAREEDYDFPSNLRDSRQVQAEDGRGDQRKHETWTAV